MMSKIVFLALLGCVCAQSPYKGSVKSDKFAGKFVYDLLKPALNSAEAVAIETSKDASYPTLAAIPATKFDCSSKAGPGFYADVETQCQVFHRCELSGNVTDYICVNTTVFNQITLICDKWYNVDCGRSLELEDFANSRLYTDKPLFDTPPADYVAPSQQIAATVNVAASQPGASGRSDNAPAAAAPTAGKGKASPGKAAAGAAKPAAGAAKPAAGKSATTAAAAAGKGASTAAAGAGASTAAAAGGAVTQASTGAAAGDAGASTGAAGADTGASTAASAGGAGDSTAAAAGGADAGASTAASADAGAGGNSTAAADQSAATTAAPARRR